MKAVINTTPLVSLAAIDKLCLLDELFENVYIPNAVFKEATKKGKKNATVIKKWGKNKTLDRLIGDGVYISENLYDKALSLMIKLFHWLLKNRFFIRG